MTDPELARALTQVIEIDTQARDQWNDAVRQMNAAEQEDARTVVRQSIALRNVIERWIANRARRSAQHVRT
jgi:hypothetical protein